MIIYLVDTTLVDDPSLSCEVAKLHKMRSEKNSSGAFAFLEVQPLKKKLRGS